MPLANITPSPEFLAKTSITELAIIRTAVESSLREILVPLWQKWKTTEGSIVARVLPAPLIPEEAMTSIEIELQFSFHEGMDETFDEIETQLKLKLEEKLAGSNITIGLMFAPVGFGKFVIFPVR